MGWKLALVVKGLAKESLLETYGSERRGAALRLIEFDRKISTLMANKWPPGMPESPDDDINEVLAATFDDAAGYNTGLKISYDESIINTAPDVNRAYSSIQPGLRAPDANLLKVGTLESIRLQSVTPNRACMYVMAFVGEPRITLPNMACFSTYMADPCSFKAVYPEGLVQVVTIAAAANTRADAEETLGIHPFGTVYFDDRRQAHQRYGVNLRSGALVVVRPDGHVGFTAELSQNGGQAVTHYFERFLVKN